MLNVGINEACIIRVSGKYHVKSLRARTKLNNKWLNP